MASEENQCQDVVPGDKVCTGKIWNQHHNKQDACPGTMNGCVSWLQKHPQANMSAVEACKDDKVTTLRRIGHFEHLNEKASRVNLDLLGSTHEGLGHLSDAHATGRSATPIREQRFPKTLS